MLLYLHSCFILPFLGRRQLRRQSLTLLLLSLIVEWFDCCLGVFAFSYFLTVFLVCRSFRFFALLLYPRLHPPVCIQLNSAYKDCCCCVAVPMSTYEGCCRCTYDLRHSAPWLLLSFFIVELIVYHAVRVLCHSHHPAHAFV